MPSISVVLLVFLEVETFEPKLDFSSLPYVHLMNAYRRECFSSFSCKNNDPDDIQKRKQQNHCKI